MGRTNSNNWDLGIRYISNIQLHLVDAGKQLKKKMLQDKCKLPVVERAHRKSSISIHFYPFLSNLGNKLYVEMTEKGLSGLVESLNIFKINDIFGSSSVLLKKLLAVFKSI